MSIKGGKAYVTEQKNKQTKNDSFQNKKIQKQKGKRLKLNNLIKKVTNNMNRTKSVKCDFVAEKVERKSLADYQFCKIYNFY